MFALLGSRLGAYLIIGIMLLLLIGGVALHMKLTANTVNELRQQVTLLSVQTDSLKAANTAMQADVAHIVAAQIVANDAIQDAQSKADIATNIIRNRTFSSKNNRIIQAQVNAETAAIFQRVQATSRAP